MDRLQAQSPDGRLVTRSLVAWLALLAVAIMNGTFREAVLDPRLGSTVGHIASTALLCIAIALIAWLSVRWIGARSVRDGVLIGVLWLVLTLAFEFLAGHYLFGHAWERLLADYDLTAGRVWVAVLLTTLLAPIATAWRLRVRR